MRRALDSTCRKLVLEAQRELDEAQILAIGLVLQRLLQRLQILD
jgi:hypothetical protein